MTHRKLLPGKLVIASHNAGKVREIRALLAPFGIEPVSAGELGLPEPEETGTTFAENALLKAHASAQGSDLPALADDSGLCVAALSGAPGVYTADWAEKQGFEGGPGRDWYMAMARLRVSWLNRDRKPTGAPISFAPSRLSGRMVMKRCSKDACKAA